MSTLESTGVHAADPASSLLARRPGHGPMRHLVRQAAAGGWTAIPADRAPWRSRAIGELIVGHELAQLPPEWQVLHSVPAGVLGARIDHLVIGPGGVFVLRTAHHPRQEVAVGSEVVWLDGSAVVGLQRAAAKRAVRVRRVAAGILGDGHAVQPLLVFVGATSLTRMGVQSVPSADQRELVGFLQSQPRVLTATTVATLVARLGRPETWGAAAAAEPDPTAAFLALDARTTGAVLGTASATRPVTAERRRPRPAAPSRLPARPAPALRLVHAAAALLAALVVLPLGVAALVTALSAAAPALLHP